MNLQLPAIVTVAVFEVTRALDPFVVGDRILARPTPQGTVYELYRRLRAEDVEGLLTPTNVAVNATVPDAAFGETARLFARSPSSQPGLRRLK